MSSLLVAAMMAATSSSFMNSSASWAMVSTWELLSLAAQGDQQPHRVVALGPKLTPSFQYGQRWSQPVDAVFRAGVGWPGPAQHVVGAKLLVGR